MKKFLSLLLVAIMCFGLVACGGDTNTDAPGSGNGTSDKTSDVDLSYVGTWKGYTNGEVSDDLLVTMVLNEDGTGTWNESGETVDGKWSVKDGVLSLDRTHNVLEFNINDNNGVVELNFQNVYVLVLESEFNK